MKKLFLFRHGKAAAPELTTDDYTRPLADSGPTDVAAVANQLVDSGACPAHILTSPAIRAFGTAEIAARAFSPSPPIESVTELYEASQADLLALTQKLNNDISEILIVGHNPAIGLLAKTLAGTGEVSLMTALAQGFSTAALAGITFNIDSWHDAVPGGGVLNFFLTPHSLGKLR